MISLVENTLVSYGAGLVAGETTTLINQGSITNDCGIPRLDEIIFEVGIQRDKDTYVEMENGKNKVLDKFGKKFISNGGNSLFFTSRDMYSLMESRYNGKFVLGWYNPSNKSLKCIGDNSYLARIKVMETSPVNPTASASFPSGGKYYNGLKTTYTLDTISELANGAWKNYINNNTYGGMQVWSWILQKTGSGTWDIKNRLERLTNPTGLDLNKVSEWTPEQQYEHKLRILDLLLMYYEIFPNEHQGKAEVASAIDDWITGRNLTETPVTFVITTSVAVNPGEPTNQATGHILTRTIDYLNYVSGAELAYMVNGPFYDAIVPAATAPAGGNNTYKNLEGSINQSIKASPTFNRITNTANRKNGFYYGLSAMAKYRIKTGDGYVVWATKSTQISVLDALQISEKGISGFMLLLTAPIGSKSLEMVVDATPDEEVVETPKIGRVANIKIDIVPDAGKISTWKPVTDYANVNNKTIDVLVKITRTPSGGSYTPNYSVTAKKFTGSEFLTFIQGNSSIDIIDSSVAEYEIAENKTEIFRYDVELDITANGNTTKLTGFDTCSFERVRVLDQTVFYNSNPVAYAEIKEGSPYNESFEAMAGVPTTEKLYFSSGGSEFIVEVKLQYVQDTKTERTYRSEYSGTSCEFKDGDTAKGLGGAPNHGGLASSDTVYQTGPSGGGGCGSPPGWTPPNPGPKTYTYTSASDKVTRSVTVQPVFHDTSSTSVSHGCSGHGSGESFYTCGHCTCSYSYSYSGYWTYTIPMHSVCGPCCQHELPPILDTWKQSITYDHMKIIEAHVWKIDQASVNGMTEITGTDTIKASIIQGNPNIFYNIADLGNPANDGNDSEHGRLRYTVEPQQHDVVVWNEGTRTNKCNGIVSHRSNVNPVANNGHQNSWATGILYTNAAYTNEENYHRNRGTVSTGVSNVADPKDIQTTEWKKFNEHRTTLNTATVISDMLILQTSSGDQSVIYFQKDSTPKQTQQNFDKVVATREEMWDNNTQSAAQWTPYQINIGSYNGNYASMTTKYNGTGKGERVATKFDSDPAKVSTSYKAAYKWITRPARVTDLRLYKNNISQIVTNPNKQYITGNAETFWESILNYESTVGALRSTDYNSKYGKNGYVKKATYSPEHSKVNDIVVHNPVSVEDAAVVGLDESRDQRSTMPIGSAEETLDNINKLKICPRDPGLCEFRVLNCTYYEDRVLASFDFESGAINKITNIMYNLPSGFTIENVNRFGTGKSLSAKGVRWSIALTDLGITYNENTKLYVEADFRIPFSSTASRMVVSFAGYDFYIISGQTIGGWNTGNGAERQANVNIIDKNIKLGIEFDFSNVDNNKLFVNGVEHKVFTRTNASREVTADRVGNYINIGSWTANNNYPADFYLDNLKIVKKGGTSEHTSACYKPVTLHPDGFNYHRHSIECLGVGSTTTGKITTFNYTGNYQQYVAPRTGEYTLEVWGAQGGAGDSRAGKGGYAKGTVNLTAGEVIHIYVGGSSGFNGGATSNRSEGYGGGASDIRIGSGTLYDRIIVAGGGGGFGGRSDGIGGSGGGASGGNGGNGYGGIGYGGTQTAGGAGGRNASSGTFGNGGAAGGSNANGRAGGGGGWYGGGGGGNDYPNFNDYDDAGAGGGSGYVFTSTSHKPSGYNVASKYYMTGGTTQAGVHSGNGMAKITEPKNEGIEYAMELLRDGNITKVKELLGEELYREIVKNNLIYAWAFSGTDTKGFKATNKASVTVDTNKLLFSITGNDPQSEVDVDIDASAISYMKIYFDNNSTGTLGQVFWKKTGTSYAEANSIKYNMTSMTANQVQTIEFDKQSNWNGNITGLRWDFSNAASGNVKISKIEIYGFGSAEADVANNTSTTYEYTGDVQTFTAPAAGTYQLEVWGAEGALSFGAQSYSSSETRNGGKGGYSKGTVTLTEGEVVRIYVGGKPSNHLGGWNGGGSNTGDTSGSSGGGGATDIRKGGTSLTNRIIVAGGGGGAAAQAEGGSGGGLSGGNGQAVKNSTSDWGRPGTQTSGGASTGSGTAGTLGQGGRGYNAGGWNSSGGGGGGYYGGSGGGNNGASGGGGSGYIGGVSGGTTQAGVRSGNGMAKITQLTTVLKITTAMASNNLTVGQTFEYNYSGAAQQVKLPAGKYKVELWGAQGGNSGALGAYVKDTITIAQETVVNLYIGGQGTTTSGAGGGWNGGGNNYNGYGGGGGATDIRIGGTALANRTMVAAGGAGRSHTGNAYATHNRYATLGQGQHATSNHAAGGGGGYYGGTTSNSSCSSNAYSGSCYVGGTEKTANYSSGNITVTYGNRSANGYAKITYVEQIVTVDLTAVENKIKENTARIPNNLPDGSPNPIFICHNLINTPGYYNMHLCNRNCHIENVLLCSEPHHNGLHYDGSNDICWDACCVDSNHANYKPKVTTINNESIPNGKFVNMDYDFKIYFPNIGDFNQGQVSGLSTLTTIRGRGYVDNMDTTKWTREKRVRFEFNVIFKGDGKLYRAGEWIELPVTGPTYPYYEFYCVLANYEAKSAAIEYEVEAINCNGNNDNITNNTNRNRFSNYSSYHGAYHTTYIDVVGRIGNLVIDDTEDYRFSNFFKVPVPGDEWLIKGVVKKVYEGMQNQYIAYSEDIRGESIGEDTKWLNTYGTQSWLYKEPILLPLSPEKNNLIPLQSQPMRPGYDVLLDISTIGNYRTKMQIVPYYYAFDLTTGVPIPVDVYMVSEGMYRPINIFDAVKPGWDKGENVLAGSSAIGSFEMPGAELSGTSIVNTLKPDTGETVRAIRLNKDARVPVAQSPYIQLDKDVKYTIEFEYWADEDNVKFDVDLWPEDLPQKLPVANKTVQKMSWEVNSSSANMSNCKLRFFNDTTTYNPANIYITNIKITSGLYPYVMNLDWVAESARRNYDILEKAHTDALAAKYSEEIKGYTDPEYPGELAVTGTRELDRPVGKYYTLGTAQLLVPSGKARTFIGSEYTYGKLMNIGNRIQAEDWWYSAQRWHFKLGLPSSAVIVEHGKNPTIDEINKLSTGNHVILMTADIQSIGDTFVLRYSHINNNGRIKLGGKTYRMGNDLPPVIAVYSANKTAVQDVDIRGTH